MSSYLEQKEDGTYEYSDIDREYCQYLINDVCCNESCEYLGDHPYPNTMCKKDSNKRCEFFEEEDK